MLLRMCRGVPCLGVPCLCVPCLCLPCAPQALTHDQPLSADSTSHPRRRVSHLPSLAPSPSQRRDRKGGRVCVWCAVGRDALPIGPLGRHGTASSDACGCSRTATAVLTVTPVFTPVFTPVWLCSQCARAGGRGRLHSRRTLLGTGSWGAAKLRRCAYFS